MLGARDCSCVLTRALLEGKEQMACTLATGACSQQQLDVRSSQHGSGCGMRFSDRKTLQHFD
jgi:hypothetical protein